APAMSPGAASKSEARGLGLGILGVLGFSLTLPMTRLAVSELNPIFVSLGRSLISAALAAGVLLWKRDSFPGARHLPSLLVVALGVVVGFPVFTTLALREVPASHGAVVTGILPLGTALFGALRARERPSAGFWLAASAGTATIVAYVVIQSGLRPTAADMLLVAAVATCSAGYAEGGRLSRELGGLRVISWALLLASPLLAIPVAVVISVHGEHASAQAWAAFAYMGVISMFLAFWAWYEGLAMGGVARVSQVQLLQPFLTIGASWLILGERITPSTIVAALIVVATVAIGRRAPIARQP
ncbi:MAG: DMT family transporter, partial [Opitutaceae bacterium]